MMSLKFRQARPGLIAALLIAAFAFAGTATRVEASPGKPALVITDDPLPSGLRERLYSDPAPPPVVSPEELMFPGDYDRLDTVVGRKVRQLRDDLYELQNDVSGLSEAMSSLEKSSRAAAVGYYTNVGTISTQLQTGTTPGNPRLVQRVARAQANLENLASNLARFNEIAVEASRLASHSTFLLEAIRASYNLSGAVEEDHTRLAELEDAVNNTVIVLDRILNNVSDNITRTSAYLSTERSNLRTLSLAVTEGDLYGKSLSNRPFSGVSPANFTPGQLRASKPPAPRPLVKIRFNKPSVNYEQPVYIAVSEAMERYPAARFELVAVQPSGGNAAQVAIESTKARRNAEKVLRTLTQMGLPLDRLDMSYTKSASAGSSEVHIYIQ